MLTISIDTGGTFTDGFFQLDGRSATAKVDTTPHDPAVCLRNCLEAGAEALALSLPNLLSRTTSLRYATTLTTNAMIQRRGTRVGLILSEESDSVGDADPLVALLDRELVARLAMVRENGGKRLDESALVDAMRVMLQRGARAVVIALDDAWQRPALEREARAVIKSQFPRHYIGAIPIVLSSDVSAVGPVSAARNAAVVNAYVHSIMARYLYRAGRELRADGLRSPLLVMHSNGGVARVAKTLAINTYGSGPAAGLFAGAHLAADRGHPRLVMIDVGGTSSDIACTDGRLPVPTAPTPVEGIEVALGMIQVTSIGGGGGSIVQVVSDGELRVGPESAGASPGPACYGLGGTAPTITDANVALGLIDPDYFLGGRRRLDADRARRALAPVADALGASVAPAAAQARRIVDEMMAAGIRREVGDALGPDVTLLAFGGGGGLHAASVARILGLRRILVPRDAAVLSAYGGSLMDVRHLYERWVADPADAPGVHAELAAAAELDMQGEGFGPDDVTLELFAGRADGAPRPIASVKEIDSGGLLRLVATAAVPRDDAGEEPVTPHDAERYATREVYWPDEDRLVSSSIFRMEEMRPGARLRGPAVLEAPQTTVAVPSSFEAVVDGYGDLILTSSGE